MRKVSEVRLDEDNFVYTVCDDSGIKMMDFTFGEPVLKTLLTKDTGTIRALEVLS